MFVDFEFFYGLENNLGPIFAWWLIDNACRLHELHSGKCGLLSVDFVVTVASGCVQQRVCPLF